MIYHLSDENHNDEIWCPRVPNRPYMDEHGYIIEDQKHKRICFSKTKSGAFFGINFDGTSEILYLHVPYNKNVKYYTPTEKQVPDVKYTHEVWVQRKIKMKCIAKVRMSYSLTNYAYSRSWRPKVKIEYLERYGN